MKIEMRFLFQRDDFNLTMPSWVTDQFYYSLKSAVEYGEDYTAGAGKFLISEMIDNNYFEPDSVFPRTRNSSN